MLVVKEWLRSTSVSHLAVWADDRFVTGDLVMFMRQAEPLDLILATTNLAATPVIDMGIPKWTDNAVVITHVTVHTSG